jgi:Arf-GAP/Rho-GAP domain/ANK repeat/PH domain-containing protein 2
LFTFWILNWYLTFLDFPQHDIHSEGGSSQEAAQSAFLCDFLYQASAAASKISSEKKLLEGIFFGFF